MSDFYNNSLHLSLAKNYNVLAEIQIWYDLNMQIYKCADSI